MIIPNTNFSYDDIFEISSSFSGIHGFNILGEKTPSTFSDNLFLIPEREMKEIIIDNQFKNGNIKNKKFTIKKYSKKKHDSSSFDNLLTKIQVHFFSFIINIANDALLTEKKNYNFKQIAYREKKSMNHILFEEFKNNSIKYIIKKNISPKFKYLSSNYNEKLLNKICSLSNWLNEFFEMNYLKLFNFYYNNQKSLTKILFKEKEIVLSKTTKSFYDLLEKNLKDKNELINVVKSTYFKGYDIYFFC